LYPAALIGGAVFLAVLVSCATSPHLPRGAVNGNDEGLLSLLPQGARIYLWADARKGRPLLDVLSFEGKNGRDAAKILDRTGTAAAAFYPDGAPRRFYLAAAGSYPRFRANVSFAFSGAWKKLKSSTGNSYWYSSQDSLALALGTKVALASDKDPFESAIAAHSSPEGFGDFMGAMVLAGWMPNPSGPINTFLSSLEVPVQIPGEEFFFGVARVPGADTPEEKGKPWELVFRIKTPSDNQARALVTLFSLARVFMTGQTSSVPAIPPGSGFSALNPLAAASLLFARLPEQDGAALILRSAPLDEETIALLFNMFSVYSIQPR
jgi:hypothetical protein